MKIICPLLSLGFCLTALGQPLAPFGADVQVPASQVKEAKAKTIELDCLSPEKARLWIVENQLPGQTEKPFDFEKLESHDVLRIKADLFDPGRTIARVLLPGDGPANGDAWSKNRANYVSFFCKSTKPVSMTAHLLQRGKTAGSFQASFRVLPGEWQKVVLPVAEFKLKSFAKVAGLGFRVVTAEKGTELLIRGFAVGGSAFTDESWKARKLAISIDGDWRFSADPKDAGLKDKWFDPAFDDSHWPVLKSGQDWQAQGVNISGLGWYRQQIHVPKEMVGVPLKITFTQIPFDDDVWLNGERIGGFFGEYKYNNWMTRSYVVPSSIIRYGENNTMAIRIWAANRSATGNKSGLIKGPMVAEFDPYAVKFREPGGEAGPAELFDLSDAQRGKPFEMVFAFPSEVAKNPGGKLAYRLTDSAGTEISSGQAALVADKEGLAEAVVSIDQETSRVIYLRGRFQATLMIEGPDGTPLYLGAQNLDRLNFLKRDREPLAPLPDTLEETPYGKLRLVDEIDCGTSAFEDPHPYLQSGFTHEQERMPPGSPVNVKVTEILGRKARESDFGWFAYRIGRGRLKPHSTYLVRIEYPEDKPRYAPVEIQAGHNYMDVGWKNGVAADDVYDPWPLSKQWQWYDVIFPLDEHTTGMGGTETASAENGVWVYFLNKIKSDGYYTMWEGGPAVARIKLYEIDPEKNAPKIAKPEGLPHRVLDFDWERGPDHDPVDLVQYAKLMGYSAISPSITKWVSINYSDPLSGYDTVAIDGRKFWTYEDPAEPSQAVESQHVRYLKATKQYGIDYIPRIEWGGSKDLAEEAWAKDTNGQPTKPNRFAKWCANLLNPLTWDDAKKLMDHLIKPYAADNPQLTGVLWRIRCDRLPPSYGKADVELFSKETNTPLPPGAEAQRAAWAAGEMKAKYDDWWHRKRAEFHIRLAKLLQSYRGDMTLYYYNWDPDKFSIILPDLTGWAFLKTVIQPPPNGGRAAYEKDRAIRKTLSAQDYISVLRTGNFGDAFGGWNRADLGIRPELYEGAKGFEIFAPANYLCYADKPEYLNYFQTSNGLAVSNCVSYDEVESRTINPKYECNMVTPGGPAFSMALELLAYFHGDARTLNYTVYTYGRGFAEAHRRFAQAFLALPAIAGISVDQGDKDLMVRSYASNNGTYVGVAYKGFSGKKLTVRIPAQAGAKITDLVTEKNIPAQVSGDQLSFEVDSGPMELNAYLVK